MRVHHREIAIEAVDGVADESARLGAGHLVMDGVEDDEAVHVPLLRRSEDTCDESLNCVPVWTCVLAVDHVEHAFVWVATLQAACM